MLCWKALLSMYLILKRKISNSEGIQPLQNADWQTGELHNE